MKTKKIYTAILVISISIFGIANTFSQTTSSDLLAFNSAKKAMRAEKRIAKYVNKMESEVRYKAPVVENDNEPGATPIPLINTQSMFVNSDQLRQWIEKELEKVLLSSSIRANGKLNIFLKFDATGKISNVEFDNTECTEVCSAIKKVLAQAPGVYPDTMNYVPVKRYLRIPVSYKLYMH